MAKKPTPFTASAISLIEVKIIEGRVESHDLFDDSKVVAFDPDCSLRIFLGLKANLLRAELKVWVDTESEPSQPETHGHFHFVFLFLARELSKWVAEAEDNAMTMDPGLQNAIAAVSYSTARGILISRFQGTALQRFILPVINPNDLLEASSQPKTRLKGKSR